MTDAEYTERRNALIPRAEEYANLLYGVTGPYGEIGHKIWRDNWDKAFHDKMNELAREAGLV